MYVQNASTLIYHRYQTLTKVLRYLKYMPNWLLFSTNKNWIQTIWKQYIKSTVRPVSMMVQQDGATSHTSNRSITILRNLFPDRLISLRGDIGWPQRSPDLSLATFFFGDISNRESTNTGQSICSRWKPQYLRKFRTSQSIWSAVQWKTSAIDFTTVSTLTAGT